MLPWGDNYAFRENAALEEQLCIQGNMLPRKSNYAFRGRGCHPGEYLCIQEKVLPWGNNCIQGTKLHRGKNFASRERYSPWEVIIHQKGDAHGGIMMHQREEAFLGRCFSGEIIIYPLQGSSLRNYLSI